MQIWRLLYTDLVGPRGEKLESTEPFWSFFLFTSKWEVHMSFQGNYDLIGDVVREVVWTLFTYGGCNKGGSSVGPGMLLYPFTTSGWILTLSTKTRDASFIGSGWILTMRPVILCIVSDHDGYCQILLVMTKDLLSLAFRP
jgi:hypothetical protein